MKVREEEIRYKQKITLTASDFHKLLTRGTIENEDVKIQVPDSAYLPVIAELDIDAR